MKSSYISHYMLAVPLSCITSLAYAADIGSQGPSEGIVIATNVQDSGGTIIRETWQLPKGAIPTESYRCMPSRFPEIITGESQKIDSAKTTDGMYVLPTKKVVEPQEGTLNRLQPRKTKKSNVPNIMLQTYAFERLEREEEVYTNIGVASENPNEQAPAVCFSHINLDTECNGTTGGPVLRRAFNDRETGAVLEDRGMHKVNRNYQYQDMSLSYVKDGQPVSCWGDRSNTQKISVVNDKKLIDPKTGKELGSYQAYADAPVAEVATIEWVRKTVLRNGKEVPVDGKWEAKQIAPNNRTKGIDPADRSRQIMEATRDRKLISNLEALSAIEEQLNTIEAKHATRISMYESKTYKTINPQNPQEKTDMRTARSSKFTQQEREGLLVEAARLKALHHKTLAEISGDGEIAQHRLRTMMLEIDALEKERIALEEMLGDASAQDTRTEEYKRILASISTYRMPPQKEANLQDDAQPNDINPLPVICSLVYKHASEKCAQRQKERDEWNGSWGSSWMAPQSLELREALSTSFDELTQNPQAQDCSVEQRFIDEGCIIFPVHDEREIKTSYKSMIINTIMAHQEQLKKQAPQESASSATMDDYLESDYQYAALIEKEEHLVDLAVRIMKGMIAQYEYDGYSAQDFYNDTFGAQSSVTKAFFKSILKEQQETAAQMRKHYNDITLQEKRAAIISKKEADEKALEAIAKVKKEQG